MPKDPRALTRTAHPRLLVLIVAVSVAVSVSAFVIVAALGNPIENVKVFDAAEGWL